VRYFLSFIFCLASISYAKTFNHQHDCEILQYSTNIKIERNKKVEERTYLIRVNNFQGDWISDIKVPFSKGNKVDIQEAVILDENNNIVRKLKKNEITKTSNISSGAFYEDDMAREFTLRWNKYPYSIRYRYKTTYNEFLHIADWYPIVFKSIPTHKASLSIQVPPDFELLMYFPDTIQYKKLPKDGMLCHQWESSYLKKLKKEAFSPNSYDCIPRVSVVPKDFSYYLEGSFETWESFGDWQHEINESLDVLTDTEKATVDALTDGMTDKREIAQVLYNYLQENTRYINVSIETGGMVPYPAEYVCENKYGDCKALSIYMKALLKYKDIESFYTLIYGDYKPTSIIEEFPSQQFNHVILCVPIEGDTVWLENTSKSAPFNYLGTFTQNRKALLIKEGGSLLVNTPGLSKTDVVETSTYYYKLDDRGSGQLVLAQKLGGHAFELLKYVEQNYSERDKLKFYRGYEKARDSELISNSIKHKQNDYYLHHKAEYQVKNQIRKIGNMHVIQLNPSITFSFEDMQDRTKDILVSYPIYEIDSLIYECELTSAYQVKLPENFYLESRFGSFSEHYRILDNKMIVNRKFLLEEGRYGISEYPEFYAFVSAVEEAQKKSVLILKPK